MQPRSYMYDRSDLRVTCITEYTHLDPNVGRVLERLLELLLFVVEPSILLTASALHMN